MKNARQIPAVTSLPQSPRDEADHRVRRYALTMTIRIGCFALMVLVQPYGWYTWVFGIGAMVLPYVAVVLANVGEDTHITRAESPFIAIEAPAPPAETPGPAPTVVRISEAPAPPKET